MAKRTDIVPKDLVNHLCKTIPDFKRESLPHQCQLARMVWHGSSKRRRHHHFEGAMSFGYEELAEAFGRNVGGNGFDAVNTRLGFFEVTPNWSMSDGYTRGYKFSPLVTQSRNAYFDKLFHKETKLLMMSGLAMKTLPPGSRISGYARQCFQVESSRDVQQVTRAGGCLAGAEKVAKGHPQ